MKKLYTFDLFDTVITRSVFRPTDLFHLVGETLRENGVRSHTAVEWKNIRVEAEVYARKKYTGEITLANIKDELAGIVGVEASEKFIEVELALEMERIVGISEIIDEINGLMSDGERVCYVSDMYLPREFIDACLKKVGAPKLELYLSSELGITKATGRMFTYVAQDKGVCFANIVHKGDNLLSDVKIPKAKGIKVIHYKDSLPTRLEEEVYAAMVDISPATATTLAGGMKAARLSPPKRMSAASLSLWQHGTQIGGLIHIGFASWVAQEAKHGKHDKIFFLARDGYTPSLIYQESRKRDPELPEAQYLYVSRQSLYPASIYNGVEKEDLKWILAPTHNLTFAEWLRRLDLNYSDFDETARASMRFPAETSVVDASVYEPCKRLLNDSCFLEIMHKRAHEAYVNTISYLHESGFENAERPCVVDVGWNGRMQRALVRICRSNDSGCSVTGLYLGLQRLTVQASGKYKSWLFNRESRVNEEVANHAQLYETLFSAPHYTTRGYRKSASGVTSPIFQEYDPFEKDWSALILMQKAVLQVFSSIDRVLVQDELSCLKPVIVSGCYQWLHFPSREQVLAFSGFYFGSDQANKAKECLIYPMKDIDVIRLAMRFDQPRSINQWVNGQLVSAKSGMARFVVRSYRLAKFIKSILQGIPATRSKLIRIFQ